MKKAAIYLSMGFTLLLSQACQKKEPVAESSVSETVNVSINSNEAYRYNLPAGNDQPSYGIETGSATSAVVSIETTTSSSAFVYTPSQNSNGADTVVISTCAGQKNRGGCHSRRSCNKGSGKCSSQHQDTEKKHRITFIVSINKPNE